MSAFVAATDDGTILARARQRSPRLSIPRMSTPTNHSARSPQWATLALSWVDNLGAASALIGIYFVAKAQYQFTPAQSLLLGVVQGVPYVIAAALSGRIVRAIAGPSRAMSTRTMLALLHVLLALLCLLPWAWRSPASIWTLVAIYSPLTGILWPTVESFLSSGRTGSELRAVTCRFNLAWASSQVVTFWLLSSLVERHPLVAIALLGFSHAAIIPVIFALEREPGGHAPEDHHLSDPAKHRWYTNLLWCHQLVLVLSYLVYTALQPLLPTLTERLGFDESRSTLIVSVWMISRVAVFFLMERWGGWHGRSVTLVWSSAVLLSGFVLAMLASTVPVFVLGLALFGAGMGATYSAAFYYAMEVGSAGVDAGGRHEALIGVGYTVGPMAGLAAEGAVSVGLISTGGMNPLTVGLVMLPSAAVAALVWRRLRAMVA